jgi:plastocyanin
MTRLAGITAIYSVIAALALVAPLSASQDSAPADGTVPESAPLEAAPPQGVQPQAVAPEALPPEAVPPEAVPAQPSAPQEPTPPETASAPEQAAAAPAPAGSPVPEPAAEPEPRPPSRDHPGARPRATAAADTNVTIRDFEFAPDSVTIDEGDTVTWTNDGPTSHSATAEDGSFDTGIYRAGQSRSHTFNQAGTFSYFCTPHPNMRATVTVRGASSGEGAGGATDESDDTSGDTAGGTADSGAGSTASDDDSGAALPATGLDAGGVAVLGLMTLATGAWLRRRSGAAG